MKRPQHLDHMRDRYVIRDRCEEATPVLRVEEVATMREIGQRAVEVENVEGHEAKTVALTSRFRYRKSAAAAWKKVGAPLALARSIPVRVRRIILGPTTRRRGAAASILAALALAACGTTHQAEPQIKTQDVDKQVPVSCVPADLAPPTAYTAPSASTDGPHRYAAAAGAYGVLKARNDELERIVAECQKAGKP